MSDASQLKGDIHAAEDDALQKRFAALFDDGQGENARRAFVAYCKSRGYHPSEMYVLCGNDLFRRLREMVKRQEALLDEYRAANRYLFETARRLNGGKMTLPPAEETRRAGEFQRLIRTKFGNSATAAKEARRALGIDSRQFARLLTGADMTDGFIERLEELPDHGASVSRPASKGRPLQPLDRRYEELERQFSHIPKPKKHSRVRSTMTTDELRRVGEMLYGDDWIPRFSAHIGYSEWQIQSLMKGGDPTRFISEPTAEYVRKIEHAFRSSGGFTGPAVPGAGGR